MTETIDAAVAALRDKTAGQDIDFTAKFVIEEAGTIMLDAQGAREADEPADVTLTADAETFRGMLDGEVNPTSAFMSGRLSVDGDMGLAMKLGSVLS